MKRILTLTIMCVFAFAHQNLNAQCGTTINTGVCYTNSTLTTIAVDICPTDPLDVVTITFTAGSKEGCCDDVIVYSGATGSGTGGTEIYNSTAGGTSFTGIAPITGSVPGECLNIYIDGDFSSDCTGNGGVPVSFSTTCAAPPPPPIPASCESPDAVIPICTDTPLTFPGGVDQTDADVTNPNVNYGCLNSQPNPAWYYLEIAANGTLAFDISNSSGLDIDWAAWGPFTDLADLNSDCGSGASPFDATVDCDYTTSGSGIINLGTVTTGEIYAVLVANFSNSPTDITMATTATSTAVTNCAITAVCPYENESFTTQASVCSGELINFTEGGSCIDNGDTNGLGAVPDQASDLDLYYYFDGTQYEAPVGHDPLPTTIEESFIPAGTNNLYRPTTGTNTISGCGDLSTSLVNETCAPITVTFYVLQYNYDFDSGNGAANTFGEYTAGLCTPHRHDVVIYPATLSVAVTDDGSSCGTPAVELRAADATVCETLTGTACATDGDTYNYDFSATGTATALTMAGAGCALPTLTGTITCAGCTAPCNASGTMTWD